MPTQYITFQDSDFTPRSPFAVRPLQRCRPAPHGLTCSVTHKAGSMSRLHSQAVQRYMQDAQAARACLGLLRQLANSDAIKASIVGASGLELINQAVACHLTSAGAGTWDSAQDSLHRKGMQAADDLTTESLIHAGEDTASFWALLRLCFTACTTGCTRRFARTCRRLAQARYRHPWCREPVAVLLYDLKVSE